MKTVAVFGADGRTGRPLVNELVRRGHKVVASVFSEKGKELFDHDVDVRVGNVLDSGYVASVVSGVDTVVSVVGHIKGTDPRMQTKGMQNIVSAMKERGVERVLSLTGTGVRQSGDAPSFIDRILNIIVARVDPERIKDGIQHAKVLQESGLQWTIVRVLKLTENKNQTIEYRLTVGGPAELTTSRKKVAHILADLVDSGEWVGSMPVSSG